VGMVVVVVAMMREAILISGFGRRPSAGRK
jgi:hypothetical protein